MPAQPTCITFWILKGVNGSSELSFFFISFTPNMHSAKLPPAEPRSAVFNQDRVQAFLLRVPTSCVHRERKKKKKKNHVLQFLDPMVHNDLISVSHRRAVAMAT